MLTVKFLFSKYNYDIFSLFQKQNSRLIPKEKNIWVIKVPENTKKKSLTPKNKPISNNNYYVYIHIFAYPTYIHIYKPKELIEI